MLYWSLIFFAISIATGIAGTFNSNTRFEEVDHLLASAFFVISVFFFALRYWGEKENNDFLSGSENYI